MSINVIAFFRRQLSAAYDCHIVIGNDSESYIAYLRPEVLKLLTDAWIVYGKGHDSLNSFAENIRLA